MPIYLAMTARDTAARRRRTARRAALTMSITLALFAAAGSHILSFFGISLGAFRIAGGLLLFLLAIDMLRAQPSRQRTTPEETAEGAEKDDVSVFPLGIPMLSGPGGIATVMLLMSRARGVAEEAVVYAAIAATALATFAILVGAISASRRLGRTGLSVLERVMGFLLAALAVQFVVDGARAVFLGVPG